MRTAMIAQTSEKRDIFLHDELKTIRLDTQSVLDLSIVIPVMNEEESIPEVYDRVIEVVQNITSRFEVILIDDGSTDTTWSAIRTLHERDPRIKALRFRRNYGKTAALVAGFQHCAGEVIITMDGDLQDEPAEIPKLLAKIAEGYDVVSGWKAERHDPWSKTLPSLLFNTVVATMTGLKLHDFNCGFKAYRREVPTELTLYSDFHRFIPVLADWRGFRVTEVAVKHNARKFGHSKFGPGRFLRGMLDFMKVLFIMKYLQRPLHFFGPISLAMLAVGFVLGTYLTLDKVIAHASIGTRPLLNLCILLFVMGVQFFSLGLLGEMLRNFAYRSSAEFSVKQVLE